MEGNDTITFFNQADTIEQPTDTVQIHYSVATDTNIVIQETITEPDPFFAEATNHQPFVPSWAVVLFIITTALLAWVRTTSGAYLLSLIQSGFNRHTANRLYREKNSSIVHPSYRLNTLFFLSISAFIYHFKQFFPNFFQLDGLQLYVAILAICFVLISLKNVVYRFIGFLFKTMAETDEFLFYTMSGCRIMGIFVLPVSIIMFFTEGFGDLFFAILGMLIVATHSVISAFRGFSIIAQKDFSIYYLILYLCSLEILPLLLVWRVLR
ncbi:MAG TPA: DUF4271 domain-containing protein [Prolixibacteraceae bacterium]|nr:DUF4271 domain-containing protein [Prolixibacteraceae bacterium]